MAHESGALRTKDLARVTGDTTVQPRNIATVVSTRPKPRAMAIEMPLISERLEARLDRANVFAKNVPSILICTPNREPMIQPMLHEKRRIEKDPNKADFVVESERSRCALQS